MSDLKRAVLAALLRRAFYHWDDEQQENVYQAYQRNPALAHEGENFFDAVDQPSEAPRPLAGGVEFFLGGVARSRGGERRGGRCQEGPKGGGGGGEDPPPPAPPMAERVVRALDDFEAGDVDAFWQRLYHFLQF